MSGGNNRPVWRVVKVDKSSKCFLEDELRGIASLVMRLAEREIKLAEKQIKRMKR